MLSVAPTAPALAVVEAYIVATVFAITGGWGSMDLTLVATVPASGVVPPCAFAAPVEAMKSATRSSGRPVCDCWMKCFMARCQDFGADGLGEPIPGY